MKSTSWVKKGENEQFFELVLPEIPVIIDSNLQSYFSRPVQINGVIAPRIDVEELANNMFCSNYIKTNCLDPKNKKEISAAFKSYKKSVKEILYSIVIYSDYYPGNINPVGPEQTMNCNELVVMPKNKKRIIKLTKVCSEK